MLAALAALVLLQPPLPTDFRQIVQEAKGKVFPAVVYIKCVRESNEGGKKESQEVSGSGVLISPDGDLVTNWHVVDKATSVRCLLSDGRHADAKVLGSDKDTDLAVVRLLFSSPQTLPYATFGDSTRLNEGDFVMAMGAPWGLNRSVSIGIVSCVGRYLDGISEYSSWIQTDAAINPGNSGGPLVNTAGEIIGINARGMSFGAEGMGFAIPSDSVKIIAAALRERGQVGWSWSGLQLQALRDFNKDIYFDETEGVIVAETDPDSPARRAGLQPRDRILSVNGSPVTALTAEDLPTVRRCLALLPRDAEAALDVARGGERIAIKLTPREKGKVEGEELALERFDFTVKTINQFDNPDLFFHRQTGIFVLGVKYPGNAANAGIAPRDIVLKIDGKDVQNLDQAKQVHADLIAAVAKKSRVVVSVLRGGLMRQIVLDFARDFARE
ncbi:MAG: trypsin-like peptidase domain-containing protein [Phycisphaerales bacterium]